MDSSKRNWPSMFRSKSSINSHRHQWQHDFAPLISRPSYTSSVSDQERTHEPKPRWNPKPEQIKILEGIFNSGMGFGNCSTSVLLTDLMNLGGMNNNNDYYKRVEDNDKTKMQQLLSYSVSTANPTCAQTILPPTTVSPSVMSAINHIQGEELKKSMVFINEVAIEIASGPFNVKEAFGDDAVLIHSSGQPVVTNELGVTLHSLQHGAFYYLLSTAITTKSHLHSHDLEI
ncbi:WUSCHEL-related homeobox 8-like isoform X2 [Apium graveolens]|uniref:WUSCHEL-related homeobox 8-like isoform X2 n=1 Tax=Apium graveolens TaxID=4045 RepID=UPI003D7B16D9